MSRVRKNKCPRCGNPVEKDWKFCPECEISLSEGVCPACGKPVEPEWKLCPFCGRKLERQAKASGMKNTGQGQAVFEEPVTGIRFVYIEGGRFEMGDFYREGAPDEVPVHAVALDGFYMAAYQVTQEQWSRVTKENPSHFRGEDLPVEQVTWHAAKKIAERLSRISDSGFMFDLPSEAQWEYAARGGGLKQRWAGRGSVEQLGWIDENSDGHTHPVGLKQPNSIGLYDMSGNVWEWCRDDYLAEAYKQHRTENPVVSANGSEKVLRGGAWHLDAWSARCCRRFSLDPGLTGPGVGLRLMAVRME